jgi:hypothetical protein
MAATVFIQTPTLVIELALGIASYVYGPLLGLFLLGRFTRLSSRAAATGFFSGIVVMAVVVLGTPLAWTWYTLAGGLITISAARAAAVIFPRKTGISA